MQVSYRFEKPKLYQCHFETVTDDLEKAATAIMDSPHPDELAERLRKAY